MASSLAGLSHAWEAYHTAKGCKEGLRRDQAARYAALLQRWQPVLLGSATTERRGMNGGRCSQPAKPAATGAAPALLSKHDEAEEMQEAEALKKQGYFVVGSHLVREGKLPGERWPRVLPVVALEDTLGFLLGLLRLNPSCTGDGLYQQVSAAGSRRRVHADGGGSWFCARL